MTVKLGEQIWSQFFTKTQELSLAILLLIFMIGIRSMLIFKKKKKKKKKIIFEAYSLRLSLKSKKFIDNQIILLQPRYMCPIYIIPK